MLSQTCLSLQFNWLEISLLAKEYPPHFVLNGNDNPLKWILFNVYNLSLYPVGFSSELRGHFCFISYFHGFLCLSSFANIVFLSGIRTGISKDSPLPLYALLGYCPFHGLFMEVTYLEIVEWIVVPFDHHVRYGPVIQHPQGSESYADSVCFVLSATKIEFIVPKFICFTGFSTLCTSVSRV